MNSLFQNFISMNENTVLTYNWSVFYEGRLWVYSNRVNALFSIDPQEGSSQFICWTQGAAMGIRVVGIYKGCLISIARKGNFLQLVDAKTYHSRIIVLDKDYAADNEYIPILNGKQLMLFPSVSKEIILCDIDAVITDGRVEDCDRYIHKASIGSHDKILKVFCDKNHVIGTLEKRNALWIWNISMQEDYIVELGYDGLGINDIKIKDDYIYILYAIGELVVYELNSKQLLWSFHIPKSVCGETDYAFEEMAFIGNTLWFFPSLGNEIVTYDVKNGVYTIFNDYPKDFCFQFSNIHQKYLALSEDDAFVYVGQRSANYMLIIDKQSESWKWVQIRFPIDFYKKRWKHKIISDSQKYGIVMEEWQLTFADFLKAVQREETETGLYMELNQQYGREIYNKICGDGGME